MHLLLCVIIERYVLKRERRNRVRIYRPAKKSKDASNQSQIFEVHPSLAVLATGPLAFLTSIT